jgi:uncharacterized protein YjbJ (UPF0337 family)
MLDIELGDRPRCVHGPPKWTVWHHYDPAMSRNARAAQALSSSGTKKENTLDSEHVKGAADKAKGAIKDAAGKITGDDKLQAEGKFDKAKGEVHKVAGDLKDAAREASKHE